MKKIFSLLILLSFGFLTFAQKSLSFQTMENKTVITNIGSDKKTICKDNFIIVNQTSEKLVFEYCVANDLAGIRMLFTELKTEPGAEIKFETNLKAFNYVILECSNADVAFEKIVCEHNDMYVYVKNVKKTRPYTPYIEITSNMVEKFLESGTYIKLVGQIKIGDSYENSLYITKSSVTAIHALETGVEIYMPRYDKFDDITIGERFIHPNSFFVSKYRNTINLDENSNLIIK